MSALKSLGRYRIVRRPDATLGGARNPYINGLMGVIA
jgi:hypothetical protein